MTKDCIALLKFFWLSLFSRNGRGPYRVWSIEQGTITYVEIKIVWYHNYKDEMKSTMILPPNRFERKECNKEERNPTSGWLFWEHWKMSFISLHFTFPQRKTAYSDQNLFTLCGMKGLGWDEWIKCYKTLNQVHTSKGVSQLERKPEMKWVSDGLPTVNDRYLT